jgi:2Fe-2S ferredoxin
MFRITIHIEVTGETKSFSVDAVRPPNHRLGLPGNVLERALDARVDIDHSCGGYCACTMCHIKVLKGAGSCSTPSEYELDLLETARHRDGTSRLACQCVPDGSEGLVVVVPSWR